MIRRCAISGDIYNDNARSVITTIISKTILYVVCDMPYLTSADVVGLNICYSEEKDWVQQKA